MDKKMEPAKSRGVSMNNRNNGWTRWEDKEIIEEGWYWIGGHFPGDNTVSDPIVEYFNQTSLTCYRGNLIRNLQGYDKDLVVWFGPIHPPSFKP